MGAVVLGGLAPETRYRYRIESSDCVLWEAENAGFRTPPLPGTPVRMTLAAGSGANHWARYDPKVWSAIAELGPDLFVAVGDTPYGDGLLWLDDDVWKAARKALRVAKTDAGRRLYEELGRQYRRRAAEAIPLAYESFREGPGFVDMASTSFWVATWDDHETGMNNGDRDNPVLDVALETFKAFTPNPSFGIDGQGVFWTLQWGDVEIILIDDQTFRTPTYEAEADPEAATMLGERQFEWLADRLKRSDAVFKIIVCGSPFNDSTRKHDSWVTYHVERDRLMDVIAEARVDGVVLLTGDVHRSEFFRLPWLEERGGYPLYELVTSPLFQHSRDCGGEVPFRRFCAGDPARGMLELFAWLDIDTTLDDPSMKMQVRDSAGQLLMDRTIRASMLRWAAPSGKGPSR